MGFTNPGRTGSKSSRHASGRRGRRALVALAIAIAAFATLFVEPAEASTSREFHIAANGQAGASGSSRKTAGALSDLPRFVRLANPGDEILIRAGAYETRSPIVIDAGGSSDAPVLIRGIAPDGSDRKAPRFMGTRTAPYDPNGKPGTEVFKLAAGADNLTFENLEFVNQGNGVFRVGAAVSNLTIKKMSATNVRRFFENNPTPGSPSATINGLHISDVAVNGYSRGVIRLRDNTNDVVIRDVVGDSQRQDGDPFAMGVHLEGTVHDVVLERVTMRNSHDTVTDAYWNGDGFTTENGTYDLQFIDTVATGNTDAGYDLKSRSTTLTRAFAEDNKRNYRFFGEADLVASTGHNPYRRGGAGSQAQLWAGGNARVRVIDSAFADSRTNSVTFAVETNAQVSVQNTKVTMAPGAKEVIVEPKARLIRF
jgi:hypothetical protein